MCFKGRLKVVVVVMVVVTSTLTSAQQDNLQAIECPFPEGQEVSSEEECHKYTACQWTEGRCHMTDDRHGGYLVGITEETPRGYRVNLEKANDKVTMFGGDVTQLVFEVIYHESYHLQVKIYDLAQARYEVPTPLYLPESPDEEHLFRSMGPLTFEDQFIQLHTWLCSTYLYGLGENTHLSFRHKFNPRSTFPIFARDQPVGTTPMNEYGHHPYYMVMEDDDGNSHSVFLYNSNAMEYSTYQLEDNTPALTLRTIGGIIDLHFFLGPFPEDLTIQYT
ncbi:Sucrase-isomaltase-like 1, partial [Homarus americanus]